MWTKILLWWYSLCSNDLDFEKHCLKTVFHIPAHFKWEPNTLELYDMVFGALALNKETNTDAKAAKAVQKRMGLRIQEIMKLQIGEHTKGLLIRECVGAIKLMRMSTADKKLLFKGETRKPRS